jgi:uncharacterized membrane protein YdjX (TVP38/TMEM64 family)
MAKCRRPRSRTDASVAGFDGIPSNQLIAPRFAPRLGHVGASRTMTQHHPWLHATILGLQAIQHAGWVGWFLFIALYAAACLSFLPGSIFTLGAGAIYGWWGGVALVLAGNGLGSLLSLLMTRYFFRDWITRHLHKYPKAEAVAKAVEKDGWKIVLLTRLSPVMPFSLINYALGVTRISATRFFLATELGAVPSTCVYVYIGTLIGNLAKIGPDLRHHRPLEWIIQGVGLAFTIAVTVYVTRLSSRYLKQHVK